MSPSRTAVRAAGAAGALTWVGLAVLRRAAWSELALEVTAAALVLALLLRPVASRVPRVILAPPRALFFGVAALAAAGGTWWVSRHVLLDLPLSIDAGVYVMQARAMAHGHLGMPPPVPMQDFGGHFLFEGPDGRLHGVFPPGWPLALVPFVAAGAPMLAGPVVAAALVLGQASLGRAVARASGDERGGELATRASVLLALPSVARGLMTAELLSNAFVAVLVAFALALAIDVRAGAGRARARAIALGGCVGWVLASRLLDGVVLAAAVAGIVAWKRTALRVVPWGLVGALPFVALLVVEQHAATGAWLVPTQSLYFQRSDWPPTCHRLGFGPDVGCTVEHPGVVAAFGPHGYDAATALRTVRDRATQIGEDLVGFGPLLVLAFAPVAIAASGVDAIAAAWLVGFTLVYGLFYYGNTMFFGARFLFPVAPVAWLLLARAATTAPHRRAGWLDERHVRGGLVLALLGIVTACAVQPWRVRGADARAFQAERSDLRRTLAREQMDEAILKTKDITSYAAAFDPWADGERRLFTLDDGSGLLELRRAHPHLPVLLSLAGDQAGRLYVSGAPTRGLLVELERAWPSFVRPRDLGAKVSRHDGASGGLVLHLAHGGPGASVAVPFQVAVPGDYTLHLGAFSGPAGGDYALELDGAALGVVHGYTPAVGSVRIAAGRRTLDGSRHELVVRCVGHDPASAGFEADLDALVGD